MLRSCAPHKAFFPNACRSRISSTSSMIVDKSAPPQHDPPPYAPPEAGPSIPAALPPPSIARCNLLGVERTHERVAGSYVIDPLLEIPEHLLQPLSKQEHDDGERRANLRLESTYGRIDVDTWVLDSHQKATRLMFQSSHGAVAVRLHALGNAPCKVAVSSTYGAVTLGLPRDYVGTLTIRTQFGGIAPLPPRVLLLSEAGGEKTCFVGDLNMLSENAWHGSSIDVTTTYGRIKIAFAGNELETKKAAGGAGIWSWFGSRASPSPSSSTSTLEPPQSAFSDSKHRQ